MQIYTVILLLTSATSTLGSNEYKIEYVHVAGQAGQPGGTTYLKCVAAPKNTLLFWQKNGTNITADSRTALQYKQDESIVELKLTLNDTHPEDSGLYSCTAVHSENRDITKNDTFTLNVTLPGRVVDKSDGRVEEGQDASLSCRLQGYPIRDVKWSIGKSGLSELIPTNVNTKEVNNSFVVTTLQFRKVTRHENGSYLCEALGPEGPFNSTAHLYVLNKPNVTIDTVKAVGAKSLYVNWTAFDGNEPIEQYFLQIMKNGSTEWMLVPQKINGSQTSYLLTGLQPETAYMVRLKAKNLVGESEPFTYHESVSTLAEDPEFVPVVQVKGTTSDSVSIGWSSPRPDVRDFFHSYQIALRESNHTKDMMETFHPANGMDDYMFTGLKAVTTYTIKIQACSDYTKKCGNWSKEVTGTTLEGIPDAPMDLIVECRHDNISKLTYVAVSWKPPQHTFGKIARYQVTLHGVASFRDEQGNHAVETIGPNNKTTETESMRFEPARPNTNYTVKVAGMTKLRHVGKIAEGKCRMPPTVPKSSDLSGFDWKEVHADGRWLIQLNMHRVNERNGPIRCYIVYLVKLLPGQDPKNLPPPEEIPVRTYHEVKDHGGAYIADALDTQRWASSLYLGDGHLVARDKHCLILARRTAPRPVADTPTTSALPTTTPALAFIPNLQTFETSTEEEYDFSTPLSQFLTGNGLDAEPERAIRSAEEPVVAHDGELEINANYTGFVEVLVLGDNELLIPAYSGYLGTVSPGPVPVDSALSVQQELAIALHVLIGLVVLVFILLVVLFILHIYTKTVSEEQGIDMTFTNTLMHLCRQVGGRHVPVSSSPPDLPPIAKKDLPMAVAERHKDSDYGFQHEFELLPDRFSDRTTRASEARENFYKNRYPDIKAYDQTRVRLSLVDNTPGSDYINANYVIGYKERKKFICAQGPMDTTVNDFWRLVWEQNLEMILMLTNLEEYSKTKCAQYWPEASAGVRKFGEFSVVHVRETRFADYLVRELSLKHGEGEERNVVQYHYLVWKDFMAPDNPAGILKFIRRINEAYSLEKGPILVHCSAGVGRTGTLVALDSLLQQLREENQVAIFNTVCDLRHQRNFLVQSLKQYIFIYRALLEVSLTGDTEIKLPQLKGHIERMRNKENGKDRCLLEDEFDKLVALVDERTRSWSVASTAENADKNRNPELLPLDRNRVMLSPVPGRDHSTYINASFIEGYDSPDAIIITQDPMTNTLPDFWRMISEHSIHTIVMLSDLGDGPRKCIRYWPEPDDESVYDNIKVRYIQSESCPYYTRREFSVTNLKNNDTITTTQFQYNGWPTVEGVLPEVTRGMIELVDQTTESHAAALKAADASPGPLAVHCNWGSDRSSIFTALMILVAQLKTERAVDVFSVARKLRTQRGMMLDTFAQYDFVHRAILNYAELHHMTENGTASPL